MRLSSLPAVSVRAPTRKYEDMNYRGLATLHTTGGWEGKREASKNRVLFVAGPFVLPQRL